MSRLNRLAFFLTLASPLVAGVGADTSQALKNIELDPQECYRVRDLEFRRGDVGFYLTDGFLAFSKPVDGAPVAAIFSPTTEGGDAEIILLPPGRDERRMLSMRAGVPNIDEHLTEAAFFFADDSAAELKKQMAGNEWIHKDEAEGGALAQKYLPVLRNMVPAFETRLLLDLLTGPRARQRFFAAALIGKTLGAFQMLFDPRSPEEVVAGQVKGDGPQQTFDIWTSYTPKSLRASPPVEDFHAADYHISAQIDPQLHMRVETVFTVRDVNHELRALSFDLSRQMSVISAEVDGASAETAESANVPAGFLDTGDRLLLIVPSQALAAGTEHKVKVVHQGDVITAGPNHVYFVGSRGRWYPHRNLEFSRFDLTFRFPKNLDLVAPGDPVRDGTEGDERIIERRSDVPLPMAGFNLGDYTTITVKRGGFSVEMCANRQTQDASALADTLVPFLAERRAPTTAPEPNLPPDPNASLKNLANRIGDIMEFYSKHFGPPPLDKLIVSPIPGRFGQGFAGLIYLSTMAYMSPSGRTFSDMDAQQRAFFTELMRAHETAHQWWGNLVMTAGYHDEWINEALANYSAILYMEKNGEGKAADVLLEAYRQGLLARNTKGETVESAGPVTQGRRIELDGKPGAWVAIMYGKGTWIMQMLRARLGDEAFWKMLAELRRRYQRKALTTDQFRALCAEFMPEGVPDQKLEAFFDQWVWGTGIPALKLTTSVKGGVNVTGTLSQSGVDDDFSADFPVEVFTRGKTITKWVRSSSEPVAFSVAVNASPQKVDLDPQNSFLKK